MTVAERQGRTGEAKKLYQEFIKHFPDQWKRIEPARVRLGFPDLSTQKPKVVFTEIHDEKIDGNLEESVFREVYQLSSRLEPGELLLTTFKVEHDKRYPNEGLPPEFSVQQLHYAPSRQITEWFSWTRARWKAEARKQFQNKLDKEGQHEELGSDRWNLVTGFGQSFAVPNGMDFAGRGRGSTSSRDDTHRAFFFSDGDFRSEPADVTKRLQVRLEFEAYPRDKAQRLLATPLKVEVPVMGDEPWSLTLPASPAIGGADEKP